MKKVVLYIGNTEVELGEFLTDTDTFIKEYIASRPNVICKQVSEHIWEGYFKGIEINREIRIMGADMDLSSKEVINSMRIKMDREKREMAKLKKEKVVQEK